MNPVGREPVGVLRRPGCPGRFFVNGKEGVIEGNSRRAPLHCEPLPDARPRLLGGPMITVRVVSGAGRRISVRSMNSRPGTALHNRTRRRIPTDVRKPPLCPGLY